MVHAALLLLMLEARYHGDLVSPSAESAAPKIFSYPQAARPITPSFETIVLQNSFCTNEQKF
jgi:hypothetical protein